jgi:hypothetical protein
MSLFWVHSISQWQTWSRIRTTVQICTTFQDRSVRNKRRDEERTVVYVSRCTSRLVQADALSVCNLILLRGNAVSSATKVEIKGTSRPLPALPISGSRPCVVCRVSGGVAVGEGPAQSFGMMITFRTCNKIHQRYSRCWNVAVLTEYT